FGDTASPIATLETTPESCSSRSLCAAGPITDFGSGRTDSFTCAPDLADAAGNTSTIDAVDAMTAKSSSLRMSVLLSGALRCLCHAEFYCPMSLIHYAYSRRTVNPCRRPPLRPGNPCAD